MPEERRPYRLLVVDDEPSIRDLFRYTMEGEGYEVDTACDGVEGLQRVQTFSPDLILLDLMMPQLGGFEVISSLQALGLGAIPVVVLTAYGDEASKRVLQEPNVVELCRKPLRFGELAERIRAILEKRAKKP